MQIRPGFLYAVLTGDFIRSSNYSVEQRDAAFQALRESTAGLVHFNPEIKTVGIEPFRGDAWQLLQTEPQSALATGFFFRAALRMRQFPDTRISIGIGTVDAIPDQRLAQAGGEAFSLSGKGLDNLKKNRHMTVDFSQNLTLISMREIINSALGLAGRMADEWSYNEARAVWGAMQKMTQAEIGKLWPEPIRQQSVGDALKRACWDEIENLLSAFSRIDFNSLIRL